MKQSPSLAERRDLKDLQVIQSLLLERTDDQYLSVGHNNACIG